MVVWVTGKASAGKTTYAQALARSLQDVNLHPVILDGDWVRDMWADLGFDIGFTDAECGMHQKRMAGIAAYLEKQGIVPIIACVSPSKDVRKQCRKMFIDSILIYITGGFLWPGTSYDIPDDDELFNGEIVSGNHDVWNCEW